MDEQIDEILTVYTAELDILLEAKTVEEALYGLIAYLSNGLKILNEVVSRLKVKNS